MIPHVKSPARLPSIREDSEREDAPLLGKAEAGAVDVVLVAMANGLNQADRAIMPIAIVPMAQEFGWTHEQQGWVLSAFAVGYLACQLPAGWVAVRTGRPLAVLLLAVLVWSLSVLSLPWAARGGFARVLYARLLLGMAEAFALPCTFQFFAARIAAVRRARAFSVLLACGALGQLLAVLVCPQLSWPQMFLLFGGFGVAWSLVAFALLRSDELSVAAEAKQETWGEFARAMSAPPLLAVYAAHVGQNWTNYTLANWLPTYLHEVHNLSTAHLSVTAVPYLVAALSAVVLGLAADASVMRGDDVRSVRCLATGAALLGPAICHLGVCAGMYANVVAAPGVIMITSLSYLLGAAGSSGYMANHADLSDRAGITFAVSNVLATVPGVVTGPVTARLVDTNWGWSSVFLLAAGINIVAAFIYMNFAKAHRII